MRIQKNDMVSIRRLVGDVSEYDLRHVECYVSNHFGIFIPSVGFCEYAITPSHTHPAYSFLVFFSIEQSIFRENIPLPDAHYLAAILSPEVPHEEEPADSFRRYIAILIEKDYFERVYKQYQCGSPGAYDDWKQFAVDHEILLHIKKFMAECQNRIVGHKSILEALSEIITHSLIRSLLGIKAGGESASERYDIENMIEYMHQNFGEKITIKGMAKKYNMSESHFIRIFKKDTGLSPIHYLTAVRIEKAKKLLEAGTKNITEISLVCGFNSVSHFSSSFSKHAGISPSKYQDMFSGIR